MTKHYDQAYFDRWYRDPALKDTAIATLRARRALPPMAADFSAGSRYQRSK